MKALIVVLGMCVLLASTAPASPFGGFEVKGFEVNGEIVSSSGPQPGWILEFRGPNGGSPQTVDLDLSGSFVFHAQPGRYTVRILGPGGQVLTKQIVDIYNPGQQLSIHVPKLADARVSNQATVSLSQLRHKVPSKALKAFAKGQDAARKHNNDEALKYFREAATIDPEFADAHSELGASLIVVGRPTEGIDELYTTISLVSNHETALYNLCVALGQIKRWEEAKSIARRFLELDPNQPAIHFVLGVSLMLDKSDPAEALDHLLKASSEVPKARLLAADLLGQAGRRAEAVTQLEEYLRVSPPDDTELAKVKSWLVQLQQ